MAKPQIQTSFAAGELSPSLYGHVDFAKFAIGCATSRNMWTNYRGGAWSRAGTEFVGFSKQTILNVATGFIHFPSNPSPGQGIILNGVAFTFVSGAPSGQEFTIGLSAGGTIALAVIRLNTVFSTNPLLNGATYSDSGGSTEDDLIVTWNSPGPAGNTYRLVADSPATVSGPTLSGGGSTPPLLVTFQFNLNQGLVLEFGENYMRVIDRGAFVVTDEGAITAATKSSPATITQVAHGYTSGFWVFIDDVQGMTELNGRTFIITVTGVDTYQLFDVYGDPINSTGYTTYATGGTGSKVYELETPYDAVDLPFLKYTQSADVMSLCLVNQQTGTEYNTYDLGRLANDDWELNAVNFTPPIGPPLNVAADATTVWTTTSVSGMTDYQYVVTSIDFDTGRESVASNIGDAPDSVDISAQSGSIVITWDPVVGAEYYNIYKALPAVSSTVPDGSLFGFCGQVFGQRFVDSNIGQDMSTVPPLHRNPFAIGAIIGVTITDPGSSLVGPISTSTPGTVAVTTATGSGMTGYMVIEGGEAKSFVVTFGGEEYEDTDTIAFADGSGVQATGYIDFSVSGNPTAGDTVTLNGRVFTFVNPPGGWPNAGHFSDYTIAILFDLQSTLINIVDALTTGTTYLADTSLNVASYTNTTVRLEITYNIGGTIGNAYTLAASAANTGVSSATLTNGAGDFPSGTLIFGEMEGTFPSVVGYVQQRRTYASTKNNPDTYWMSQPGDFLNFDSRIPTLDSDAIVGAPWSVQVDGIQFMIPLLGGMIMLTGQAAYQVTGQGGSPTNPQPITPSSQQALPQAFNGTHYAVRPVQIDYDIYYLQAKGSVIRNLSYNFWINVFTGVDITYLSSHLFSPFTIKTMSWCEEPYKLLWAVRSDGILLCLTNVKSQEVMAWTRHDTQGKFSGSTSVIEPPVDALYVVTQRYFDDNEPFIIERMNDRLWADAEDVWCFDCGLAYPRPEPQATLRVNSARGLGQPVDYADLEGGLGYGPNTTAAISDPTGTGCTVTLVIDGSGTITDVNFSGGTGYTNPVLEFDDPDNLFTEPASARVVLNNFVTCTLDAHLFTIGDEGSIIRCGGGIVELTSYISATEIDGQVIAPILQVVYDTADEDRPLPFDPGQWTLTAPTTTVTGLWPLVGQEVVGVADGSPIDPQTVAIDGTITLAVGASAIQIGLAFRPQLQSLYLVDDGGVTQQGRRKNIGAVTVRVESSGGFETGTNQPDGAAQSPMRVSVPWVGMEPAAVDGFGLGQRPYGTAEISGTAYVRPTPLYTGDVRVPTGGGFQKPGQVACQQMLPLPLQILAFVPEVDSGDDPEMQRGGQG